MQTCGISNMLCKLYTNIIKFHPYRLNYTQRLMVTWCKGCINAIIGAVQNFWY